MQEETGLDLRNGGIDSIAEYYPMSEYDETIVNLRGLSFHREIGLKSTASYFIAGTAIHVNKYMPFVKIAYFRSWLPFGNADIGGGGGVPGSCQVIYGTNSTMFCMNGFSMEFSIFPGFHYSEDFPTLLSFGSLVLDGFIEIASIGKSQIVAEDGSYSGKYRLNDFLNKEMQDKYGISYEFGFRIRWLVTRFGAENRFQ